MLLAPEITLDLAAKDGRSFGALTRRMFHGPGNPPPTKLDRSPHPHWDRWLCVDGRDEPSIPRPKGPCSFQSAMLTQRQQCVPHIVESILDGLARYLGSARFSAALDQLFEQASFDVCEVGVGDEEWRSQRAVYTRTPVPQKGTSF